MKTLHTIPSSNRNTDIQKQQIQLNYYMQRLYTTSRSRPANCVHKILLKLNSTLQWKWSALLQKSKISYNQYRDILNKLLQSDIIIIGNQLLNLQSRSVCSVLISYFLFVLAVVIYTDRPNQAWQFCNACHLIKINISLNFVYYGMSQTCINHCACAIGQFVTINACTQLQKYHFTMESGIPAMIFRTQMLQQLQVVEALSPTYNMW